MKKGVNLCDFGDILSHAETIGYGWNEAHDILVKANICAMYGTQHVYKEDVSEIEDEDARKIISSYFEKEGVKDFYIKPKGG